MEAEKEMKIEIIPDPENNTLTRDTGIGMTKPARHSWKPSKLVPICL